MSATPADVAALARNRQALAALEDVCESLVADERWEDAAACAQAAAHLGWMNHPELFASARIDGVLRTIAARVLAPAPSAAVPRAGARERVLHVLTEGYDTGGHTRVAWRWMEADTEREHHAVLTRQRAPIPVRIAEVVQAAGGELIALPPTAPILARADGLRRLAAGFDRVVLHIHPDDPVPALALDTPGRPPTVLYNHADHAFWLGRTVADVVLSSRPAGMTICVERRGLEPERSRVLEVPLTGLATGTLDRAAARRALGLPEDAVVLLTVGDKYKFEAAGGLHLLDVVEPVLARHPKAVLLAVGPEPGPRWASPGTGGRVCAVGRQPSLAAYYAAADVYLESYPCSSGTAVAEAAAHRLPVLAFAPDPDEAEVLGSTDAPAWRRGTSPEAYADLLGGLIADPAERERWGAAAAEVVVAASDVARWNAALEDAYARSARLGPPAAGLGVPVEGPARHDAPVLRLHSYGGLALPDAVVDERVAQLRLAASDPAIRSLFGPLADHVGVPQLERRVQVAVAAPPLDAAAIGVAVDRLRDLARAAVAERCVITVAPEAVDEAVPLIEAALAAGEDVDIDLVRAEHPEQAAPDGLLVRVPGDRFGGGHDSPLERGRVSIRENAATLASLEDAVEHLHDEGDPHAAAAIAQVAGDFACRNHAGVFASPRIERVLAEIGRRHVAPSASTAPGERSGVLHVLTEGYDTGGHTRLAWRWMLRDGARRPSVALTRQNSPVPQRLADAAEGRILRMDAAAGLLERARLLREAAAAYEFVVLHVHMFDVVPALAFAEPAGRPPVLAVDHADHLFWLGTGVADVVTACRAPAAELQARRRGIAADRSVLVPVPVDMPERRRDRADAKRELGLDPARPLIVTVAAPHKYATAERPNFHDAAGAVLEECPEAVLVAIGPDPKDEWLRAQERHPGRLHAIGLRKNVGDFLEAADLYLDSYPFSSNTSVIEAAAHGVPVLSFSPDPERQGILLTHDPAIEDLIVRGEDPSSLAARAAALLADEPRRAALGHALAERIAAVHDGPGWLASVDTAYSRARELGATPGAAPVAHPVEDFEVLHHLLFEAVGTASGLEGAIVAQLDVLPAGMCPHDAGAVKALAGELGSTAAPGRTAEAALV